MGTLAQNTKHFQIDNMGSPLRVKTDLLINSEKPKNALKKTFKLKQSLVKLLPNHWYDGVWDDLSVKL